MKNEKKRPRIKWRKSGPIQAAKWMNEQKMNEGQSHWSVVCAFVRVCALQITCQWKFVDLKKKWNKFRPQPRLKTPGDFDSTIQLVATMPTAAPTQTGSSQTEQVATCFVNSWTWRGSVGANKANCYLHLGPKTNERQQEKKKLPKDTGSGSLAVENVSLNWNKSSTLAAEYNQAEWFASFGPRSSHRSSLDGHVPFMVFFFFI